MPGASLSHHDVAEYELSILWLSSDVVIEPEDTDIPTVLLGNSVREVLEKPFVRLTRRWVGRGRVRCLLNLLGRAVASIRSLTGCPNEDATIADVALQPRTILSPSFVPAFLGDVTWPSPHRALRLVRAPAWWLRLAGRVGSRAFSGCGGP